MNIGELEQSLMRAIAQLERAKQLACPLMDICVPGHVNATRRDQFKQAHAELFLAYIMADSAKDALRNAAIFCSGLGGQTRVDREAKEAAIQNLGDETAQKEE